MTPVDPPRRTSRHRTRAALVLAVAVVVLLLVMVGLYARAARRTNHVALAQSAKPVTTVKAVSTRFQHVHEYVGIADAWVAARVGPQYVSAYVSSVLFRPGAAVRRNDVLATLDCRFTTAASRQTAAQARAISERQVAVQHEAERVQQIAAGGFASANEVEQLRARAASDLAQIDSLRAQLASRRIEVNDCILRAPFDGDVVARFVDPGAYVRPGAPMLTIADRSTIRVTADAPEDDFRDLGPSTPADIAIGALDKTLRATITRRTPATDHATRTVHFEIDIADPKRTIPVGATALVRVPVGQPEPATQLPARAATIVQHKATIFVVADGVAHEKEVPVLGYHAGELYLAPKDLPAGVDVVLDGRDLLNDGDHVAAKASEAK